MRIKYSNRYEIKYVLSREQHDQFLEILPNYVIPDNQGDDFGRYAITSLYYDTEDFRAYWDKIEGHKFRRKVRVRVYGSEQVTPTTLCFAEIKQRINKALQKKRVYIPYQEAERLCSFGETVASEAEMSEADLETVSEIRYLQQTLRLQPSCIVSYDRTAFNGAEYDAGLRITLDTNLRGRTYGLSLEDNGTALDHYFLPPEWCIMEIKVNYRVPYWLTEMIGRYRFSLRRISKYCAALERSKDLLRTQQITY